MSEWWTYGLRDLLLFSSRTYYRLFELYNVEWWPLHLLAFALGVAALGLGWRGGDRAGRALAVILALCWLWTGWAFHGRRYASINPAASYFAWAFALEALLLLWTVAWRGRRAPARASRMQQRAGLGIFLFALLAFPLMGPLLGRSWKQAEVFGMAPDPTALATLGMLLLAGVRPLGWLFPIPVAWCLVSGATLWAMASPDYLIVPLGALLAVAIAFGDALLRAGRPARK
jgi:hypothetical protein